MNGTSCSVSVVTEEETEARIIPLSSGGVPSLASVVRQEL